MALAKSQRSLRAWTRQKGRTKSGKPSTQGSKATGERYLPEKAIKALSSSEYSKTSALKRKAIRAGKQVSKQPKKIARKTKSYRSYSQDYSMTFLHTLKVEERRILREVVKRVHLKHHPEQFCTDREADKVIAVIGPETVDTLLRVGVNTKIDRV